jgi:hypothetical protein
VYVMALLVFNNAPEELIRMAYHVFDMCCGNIWESHFQRFVSVALQRAQRGKLIDFHAIIDKKLEAERQYLIKKARTGLKRGVIDFGAGLDNYLALTPSHISGGQCGWYKTKWDRKVSKRYNPYNRTHIRVVKRPIIDYYPTQTRHYWELLTRQAQMDKGE